MNILILNSNNPLLTSGIISLDIFNALKSRGHNTRLLVTTYAENYPEGVVSMENRHSHLKKRIINKFRKVFNTGKKTDTDPNYHFHELDESVRAIQAGHARHRCQLRDAVPEGGGLFQTQGIQGQNVFPGGAAPNRMGSEAGGFRRGGRFAKSHRLAAGGAFQ